MGKNNYRFILCTKSKTNFQPFFFNGGIKYPICHPLKHQSQINIMDTPKNYPHNIHHKSTSTRPNDESIWPSTLEKSHNL